MFETDFKWGDQKVQLGQFSAILDSNVVSIGKIVKIVSILEKNHDQKLLMPEVLKLAKITFGYAFREKCIFTMKLIQSRI